MYYNGAVMPLKLVGDFMAHTLTTRKNIRTTAKRTAVNRSRKKRIASSMKRASDIARDGTSQATREAFVNFESELMKGVSRGVYKKNTAVRKLKNLSKKIITGLKSS
ncbi:MAG: 30S ribosomal protein S20 [Rickettsiales bacterium]|nr:30S ribosomal protein S20 [Rickettsiales bacterium]